MCNIHDVLLKHFNLINTLCPTPRVTFWYNNPPVYGTVS